VWNWNPKFLKINKLTLLEKPVFCAILEFENKIDEMQDFLAKSHKKAWFPGVIFDTMIFCLMQVRQLQVCLIKFANHASSRKSSPTTN